MNTVATTEQPETQPDANQIPFEAKVRAWRIILDWINEQERERQGAEDTEEEPAA